MGGICSTGLDWGLVSNYVKFSGKPAHDYYKYIQLSRFNEGKILYFEIMIAKYYLSHFNSKDWLL